MLRLLADAVVQPDHIGKLYPFSAVELVLGLNRLAVNDNNKRVLVSFGILDSYDHIIAQPANDEELATTIDGVWTLAFDETNKAIILERSGMVASKIFMRLLLMM